jgi:hypothetical protein
MNILNKTFDRIYLITSFPTINRYYDLKPILDEQEIQVDVVIAPKQKYFTFDVTDSSPNMPGNWSYQSAFESIFVKSKLLNLNNFLILEDDIVLAPDYIEKFTRYYNTIPKDWQILHMGYHFCSTNFNDGIYHKFEGDMTAIGAHAVVYKNDVFDPILELVETNKIPIDLFLNFNLYKDYNTYVAREKMFYQSSYRHYEGDKTFFYKKYPSAVDLKTG